MMELGRDDEMKIFGKKKYVCRHLCSNFKAPETITEQGIIDQYRCPTCKEYLFPGGHTGRRGFKTCLCCGNQLTYVSGKNSEIHAPNNGDDFSQKLSSPSLSKKPSDKKSYAELIEFIEDGMKLKSNYQLVMLKYLVNHIVANKGEISEDLAFYNSKNFNDIDEVKKFFKVPVYQVLEDRGFVKKYVSDGITEYALNVELNEYEKITVNDSLETKVQEYNLEHDILENESDIGVGFDWKKNKWKLQDIERETYTPNLWIWSVTQENWEILKEKNIWGSKIPKEKISQKVKSGDQVAFYVIGTNCFKGIYEFDGYWFDSPGKTWVDDLQSDGTLRYKSQIKLKKICLGIIDVHNLYEELDLFIGKPQNIRSLILQGSSGYPSNNARALLESDFMRIFTELKNNSNLEEVLPDEIIQSENSESIEKKSSFHPQTNTSKIFVENDTDGILIKEYHEIKSEYMKKGEILSNDELMSKFNVGNMGGIRYSRKNNILILCSTLSDHYDDYIDEDANLIKYTGEGQIGEQNMTGGNYKIANSNNFPILFFKEKYQEPGSRKRGALDNIYTFVGKVKYLKHFSKHEPDRNGQNRSVLKFVLEIEK